MKTPDQWLNPPGPNGVKWVADIQIDAREGMVSAAESPDAGKSLLDRLQRAESLVVEWERLATERDQHIGKLKDRLQAAERDNGLLKEQIRVADVAYQSLHERHQAVEKSHTALRLASEELIACVRHGDQEDIGEAMAKVEAILQPKE